MLSGVRNHPRVAGIVCSISAVGLGLFYMALAGAPERHLLVNSAAIPIGLLLFAAVDQLPDRMRGAAVAMPAALALLATALFGISAEGATRWANIGPILLQPSLILLPIMALALVSTRGPIALASIVIAAIALGLQPDRAMAGALAACVAALAATRPDRWSLPGLVAAVIAFGVTLARLDNLPAMPYVDGILYSAFQVHPLAGLAVVGGAGLLMVPAIVGWRRRDQRPLAIMLGTVWSAIIAAAALGNYPTPLVGYGGSAVIGYLLSLSLFPKARFAETLPVSTQREERTGDGDGASLAVGLS